MTKNIDITKIKDFEEFFKSEEEKFTYLEVSNNKQDNILYGKKYGDLIYLCNSECIRRMNIWLEKFFCALNNIMENTNNTLIWIDFYGDKNNVKSIDTKKLIITFDDSEYYECKCSYSQGIPYFPLLEEDTISWDIESMKKEIINKFYFNKKIFLVEIDEIKQLL